MKKRTRQRRTNVDPARQRRLELARDTVRTLGHDELLNVGGGDSGCDTGSTPTQPPQR